MQQTAVSIIAAISTSCLQPLSYYKGYKGYKDGLQPESLASNAIGKGSQCHR